MNKRGAATIKGYCAQCSCFCPTICRVEDGIFTEVRPDKEHPLAVALCPKGLAGPELVYNQQRLKYPMRRTQPKTSADPGWERITWDEALATIATRLSEIKASFGAEAVAFARSGPAGSAMSEVWPWLGRVAYAFGTPNHIATTHICQWHRDHGSAYTYGRPGAVGTAGRPEFERAACILIWGNNVHATRNSLLPMIKRGLERGAKLIVIDPRRTEIAAMADLWLQVRPGTDGALALSLLQVMMTENLYDHDFTRDWTTAPFLVRNDTGNWLRASDLASGGDPASYVMMDPVSHQPMVYHPGTAVPTPPLVDGTCTARSAEGRAIECQTAFRRLREMVANYPPDRAQELTGVPRDKIRDAATMLATTKPACYYSWNGIEANINASQTNRALCILYALTGNYDKPGGNVLPPALPVNPIGGLEFIDREAEKKRLGFSKRPLGPAGMTARSIQSYEVYRAILTGIPYPVKALVGFGGNLVTSNPPAKVAKEALSRLDFHVQADLFLTPTAALADIVLPVASSWESWHVGINVKSVDEKAYVQMRPAVVPPQHEAWPDIKIAFELAKRLGLGDKVWEGDIEAAFNYQLDPSGITIEQLRMNPGGIAVHLPMAYQKYSRKDDGGNFRGFPTTSKRVEIYSLTFKEHGYDPLPTWQEPAILRLPGSPSARKYPLILINAKVVQYCHSQHRALPSLRKAVPHPFLEINPVKARELGCQNGDWVRLETPCGSITVQAKLTENVSLDVVCTQNGWWQACPELNLPGYDPFSPEGANVNLLYNDEEIDPISGSLPIKGYPCRVSKATGYHV